MRLLFRIKVNDERHFYVQAENPVEALKLFIEDRKKGGFEGADYAVYEIQYVGVPLIKEES